MNTFHINIFFLFLFIFFKEDSVDWFCLVGGGGSNQSCSHFKLCLFMVQLGPVPNPLPKTWLGPKRDNRIGSQTATILHPNQPWEQVKKRKHFFIELFDTLLCKENNFPDVKVGMFFKCLVLFVNYYLVTF